MSDEWESVKSSKYLPENVKKTPHYGSRTSLPPAGLRQGGSGVALSGAPAHTPAPGPR
jgi:hypothetical protein